MSCEGRRWSGVKQESQSGEDSFYSGGVVRGEIEKKICIPMSSAVNINAML